MVHDPKAGVGISPCRERNLRRYEIHVQPYIGQTPVTEITPPLLLEIFKRIQAAGTLETAHRVKGVLSGVFQHAIAKGLLTLDPTAGLSKAMVKPPKNHYPAPLDPSEIGRMMKLLWSYVGTPPVMTALKIAPYVFCRTGELRTMKWSEIDLDAAIWSFSHYPNHNDGTWATTLISKSNFPAI